MPFAAPFPFVTALFARLAPFSSLCVTHSYLFSSRRTSMAWGAMAAWLW